MNPEEMFRALRDDDRWVGLPPSDQGAHGYSSRVPGRRPGSRRTLIVTAVVAVLVAVVSVATIRLTAGAQVATTPTPSVTPSTTASPTLSPPTTGVTALTLANTTCGAVVPSVDFTGISRGQALLPDGRGSGELHLVGYAAAGARSTAVNVRVSGGSTSEKPATYAGALHVALVQNNHVVATATGSAVAGSVGYDATALLSVALPSKSCATGAALPDGNYSIVALGPAVTVDGFVLHPTDARRPVHLRNGVLVSEISTAPNGPWHGTGAPTCGTAVDTAAINAFTASTRNALQQVGLTLRITGFQSHANATGRDFVATLTNSSNKTLTVTTHGQDSTTVIADSKIVSTPDSGRDASIISPYSQTLRPGKSIQLLADSPDTGCDLAADGTSSSPSIGNGPHFAYIDFDASTNTGLWIVMTATYTSNGDSERTLVSQ